MTCNFNDILDEMGIVHELPKKGISSAKVSTVSVNTPLDQASEIEVRKPRLNYKERKAKKLLRDMVAFQEENPGIIAFIVENLEWSGFFQSLHNFFLTRGYLTDNQLRAVRSAQAKMVQKAKVREDNKTSVDLSLIKTMFDHAQDAGLKRTAYQAEGLKLSPAGQHSRNPGAIYVKSIETDQYLGKIVNGVFIPVSAATEDDKAALLRIAEDPKESAIRWGQKTGRCSCCGRELTDPNSIAAGIGPICASKWGF